MIWVDYCILAILALSAIVGIFRGFVREVFNVGTWILAVVLSMAFAGLLAERLEAFIDTPSIRLVVSNLTIFISVLFVGAMVTHFVAKTIRATPFSGPNRALGAGFGLLRGGLIVAVILMLLGLTVAKEDPWRKQSAFVPYFEPVAVWLENRLPEKWKDLTQPKKEEPPLKKLIGSLEP